MIKALEKPLYLIIIVFILSSCVSQKKLSYLQYTGSEEVSELPLRDERGAVTPVEYKVIPYDNLFIRVLTPDPQWSAIFNATGGEGGSITQESASLLGYTVDIEGNIEIPYVGKVHVEGNTLSEIKTRLDSIFTDYLNDASITVKLVNNYVSIIGEVTAPGRYPITKERINVFEALAMAGDIGDYGNRQKVQLIRPTKYGPSVREFTLRDRSILNSEYYYIMPNDIIFVQPLKLRTFQMNSSVFSVILSSVTTLLTIIVFFR